MAFKYTWFDTTGLTNFNNFLKKYHGKERLRFLEIGAFEGRATVWMLQNLLTGNDCRITVIDTFQGGQEHNKLDLLELYNIFLENIRPWKDKVDVIVGKSQEVLPKTNGIFDFMYVDGSHIADDVFQDCINSFRLLKKQGIMAMDDYQWPGITEKPEDTPKPGIDKFLDLNIGKYTLLLKDYQVWIQKV